MRPACLGKGEGLSCVRKLRTVSRCALHPFAKAKFLDIHGDFVFASPLNNMEPQHVSLDSLIEQRKTKLAALRAKGIDPFKNKFTPDIGAGEARAKFEKGELAEHAKVSVAGRITAHRDMGKSMFIDVRDQSGRIQVLCAEKYARRRSVPHLHAP